MKIETTTTQNTRYWVCLLILQIFAISTYAQNGCGNGQTPPSCNTGINFLSDPCPGPGGNYGPSPCNAKIFCSNSGSDTYFYTDCDPAADTDGGMDRDDATVIPPGYAPPCCTDCKYVQWNQFAMCPGTNQIKIDITGVEAYSVYWTQAQIPNASLPGGFIGDCNSLNFLTCKSGANMSGFQVITVDPALIDFTKTTYFYIAFYFDKTSTANVNFKIKECCTSCTPSIKCPANATFECSNTAGINAWFNNYTTQTCGASCTVSTSVQPNALPACGSTNVTFNLMCGGQIVASCSAVITTVDTGKPVFTACPAGGELACNATSVPAAGIATATDLCGTPVITNALGAVISDGCRRKQIRTYTATDACGNTATCEQVFTWTEDSGKPVFTFCPAGGELACNATSIPAAGVATATDLCGTPAITNDLGAVISDGCRRKQIRTYTATDACGNTATCEQVFTWTEDSGKPVFTFCPAGGELACNATSIPAAGIATATDLCGTPAITNDLGAVISDGCRRKQIRTYTATDACGNTATCEQVFTWTEDSGKPVFTACPAGGELACNATSVPAAGIATATDLCGTPVITNALGAVISDGCRRKQIRTYTATDACGNTATCEQVFTWTEDSEKPVFTACPAGGELACNATSVPAAGIATATDLCGTPAITNALGAVISDGCGRKQIRTYTATDACGNTATCEQVFTWTEDSGKPVFTACPAGGELACNATSIPAAGVATATDLCGTPAITNALGAVISNGCRRKQIRTYTATDACGNTATCEQVFTWTEDTGKPVFTACPAGGELACNATSIPAAGIATATDLCGTPVITNALGAVISDGCRRKQIRTYTATDACGNTATCEQVFTWTEDTGKPVFTFCPAGGELACNATSVPAAGVTTATDLCGTVITNALGTVISDGCRRKQIRTYTATDACGNTATCEQVFTWTEDTGKPVFTFCPAGGELACNATSIPAAGTATATDLCGTPVITNALGAVISDGCRRKQIRTYTATDACGNTATCEQVFTWTEDTGKPVFTACPAGGELACNATSIPAAGTATATDLCGTPVITNDLGAVISDGCRRKQIRTYTATDACGNTATCEQVFTWTEDSGKPVFTACPAGGELACNATSIPAAGIATATDLCGTPVITNALGAVISDGCRRKQIRTYTATDACGNTATCEQVFTWTEDTGKPVFTACPAGGELACNATSIPAAGIATATDLCGTPVITNALGTVISDGCRRKQIRTYTATDACGNTATCEQVFTWTEDTGKPVFTACPAGGELACNATSIPAAGIATATDLCGTPAITNALGAVISDGCRRKQIRTYTATDACGNTATCEQVFTWTEDTGKPVFTFCPVGGELACNATSVPAAGVATATDLCGTPVITNALGTVISDGCRRKQIRTYTATDACGNTATCEQVFTWTEDSGKPVFTACPAGADLACNPTSIPAAGNPTVSDLCGVIISSSLSDVIAIGCQRSVIRTYLATDICSNTATCTQVFTWREDSAKPMFTYCPPGADLACNPTSIPAAATAIATDFCGTPVITNALGAVISDGCRRKQIRTYTATDACGNTATCEQVFTWTEDKTAPLGTCPGTITPSCFNDVPCQAEVTALVTDAYSDACGPVSILLTSDTGNPLCSNGSFARTITYDIKDGCDNKTTCAVVISGACSSFCTYTQGAYGTAGGAPGVGVTQKLIDTYGPIVIGRPALNRSLTITTEQCVLALLPGNGSPGRLAEGNVAVMPTACLSGANAQHSNGRIKNVLATQTITLILNIRYNTFYKGVNFGNYPLSGSCTAASISPTVLGYLDNTPTVSELLDLVNNYLGNQGSLPNTLAGALTTAVGSLNELFDNCSTPQIACTEQVVKDPDETVTRSAKAASYGMELYPNPATGVVVLGFHSDREEMVKVSFTGLNGAVTQLEYWAVKGMNSISVDVESYPEGIYFVALSNGTQKSVRRFVKILNR